LALKRSEDRATAIGFGWCVALSALGDHAGGVLGQHMPAELVATIIGLVIILAATLHTKVIGKPSEVTL
jgi:hypothetical protein